MRFIGQLARHGNETVSHKVKGKDSHPLTFTCHGVPSLPLSHTHNAHTNIKNKTEQR